MTVFQLVSSQGFYGMESMMLTLARGLDALGVRSVVGVFEDGRQAHTEVGDMARSHGLPVEIIRCNGRLDVGAAARLRAALDRYQATVLHTHGYKADIYGYAATLFGPVVRVATSHNWPSRERSMRAYAVFDRLVLRQFGSVAIVSERVRERLERAGVAPARIHTIWNGVDTEAFRAANPTLWEGKTRPRRVVGCVGRLSAEKGGEVFLKAAQLVKASEPDVQFVWVGEGPCRREWEQAADRLGVAADVWFAGTRTDMPGVYASLDMLVLPSLEEAMPMCLLEAMAAARPVVATRVGAVPRLIENGRTGLLVDPNEPGPLADAILRLLRDPEWAQSLARKGAEHVGRQFSAEALATRYSELYRLAIEARGRTSGVADAGTSYAN
jgi:glycosyltransferase involved in cell wall biosynthesis